MAKPVQESKAAKRKQRLNAGSKPEKHPSVEMERTQKREGTFLQYVGANRHFKVTVQEVSANDNRLEFTVLATNVSESVLTRIYVDLLQSASVHPVQISGISEEIPPGGSGKCSLVILAVNPSKPAMAKVIFTPGSCCGGPLDAKRTVFSSYLGQPTMAWSFDFGECKHEKSVVVELAEPPQECLKMILRILLCKMATDRVTKIVKLYAKASYGVFVVGAFSVDGEIAKVNLAPTAAELTDSLVSEIENLKSL
jgi:hypothetical protein